MKLLRNNFTGEIGTPKTGFDISCNSKIIIAHFVAHNSSLISYSNVKNDSLWKGNVVEMFLDLGDDFYYEFEVAPNGATFAAKIHTNKDRSRRIEFIDDSFFLATSHIFKNRYEVTMTININDLFKNKVIKYNVFRVETVKDKSEQFLEALFPTLCETFHIKSKFEELAL